MNVNEIIAELKSLANPKNVEGMVRFGINSEGTLGVSMPQIKALAKQIGKSHELALQLWDTGIHEARILAGLVDEHKEVTEAQMEKWVRDFDSWDVCDQVCMNLFDKTQFAYSKAVEWSSRSEEFQKRAAFALMAPLAVHDKKAPDGKFEQFFPLILRESVDERNFVRKAVNWALRQIGKRSLDLNRKAIALAEQILETHVNSKSARRIANDALRELKDEKILGRIKL